MQNATPKNLILLCGELLDEGSPAYIEGKGEFVSFSMKITLPTGVDVLPIAIPKNKVDETVQKGSALSVTGKLVAKETFSGGEQTLSLQVVVDEVYAGETEITSGIFLSGNVMRKPYAYPINDTLRAEFQMSVSGDGDEVFTVPVAALGPAAEIANGLSLGDDISILGQLHSYEYLDLDGDTPSQKTAYEVEVLHFTALPDV